MALKEWLRQHQSSIIAAAVLAVYVGLTFVLPMKCPILWLTGFSCPGCGITRALLCLFKLDFASAWYYNPMAFYLVPIAPVWLIAHLKKAKKLTEALLWITAGLLIVLWLYRLLVLHSPVLTADPDSGLILRALRRIF